MSTPGQPLSGLREALDRAGLTRQQLADALDLSLRAVDHWLAGKVPGNADALLKAQGFVEGRLIYDDERGALVPSPLDDGRRARTWRAAAAEMLDDVEMLYEKARHAVALRLEAEATGDEPMVTEGAADWIQAVGKKPEDREGAGEVPHPESRAGQKDPRRLLPWDVDLGTVGPVDVQRPIQKKLWMPPEVAARIEYAAGQDPESRSMSEFMVRLLMTTLEEPPAQWLAKWKKSRGFE